MLKILYTVFSRVPDINSQRIPETFENFPKYLGFFLILRFYACFSLILLALWASGDSRGKTAALPGNEISCYGAHFCAENKSSVKNVVLSVCKKQQPSLMPLEQEMNISI